jgi:cellulose synthase operon protein C
MLGTEGVVERSAQEQAFAAEVSRCLAASGRTQEWAAQAVKLSRPKISEACSGAYLPSFQVLEKLIAALGMDRDRTVELWKAAQKGRRDRQQAARLGREPSPDNWAELPVLSEEVAALLWAHEHVARELPYRLPGANRPSLATVYVRQELGSGTEGPREEQQPQRAPVLDDRGMLLPTPPAPRAVVRPPSRPVREALDKHDHLLVVGGPGQGKSTLTLRLAADIAKAWTTPVNGDVAPLAEPVVPLRLTARELAARCDGLPFPKALAACIGAEYGSLLRLEVGAQVLANRIGGCRWLLLVDALDEVASSAERDRLVHTLSAWASKAAESPYRIVLTTRPIEGTTLAPLQRAAVPRYELQPFDEDALQRFADSWFGEAGQEDAHRFIRQVRNAHLDDLVRVPLLATIAAIVFTQHSDRPLPDNQYELYESYLEFLRSAHPTSPGPFERLRTDLLEHLGRIRLVADTSLVAAAQELANQLVPSDRLAPGWQDDLTSYLAAVGPLIYRGDDLRFLHHTFAEHLAATADARLLPTVLDPEHDDFARLLHAALQQERGRHARTVLVHYTRLHAAQADHLITWLHRAMADQHLLAARLLAQHVPASAEVIDAFLVAAKAWAVTAQFQGREILRWISRAAHHPGLAHWLAGLMADDAAPWSSRIPAARALATRVHGTHARAATALLRAAVVSEDIPVIDRLTAAEGLADCGAGEREIATRSLISLLANPAVSAHRHRNAAVLLASIGGREHAVAVLSDLLNDPDISNDELVEAAAGLAEIGSEFHERCADVFVQVLRNRADTMSGRREAAAALATLGPDRTTQAVAALTALANDRRLDRYDRIAAADGLAELGPQHRITAGRHVLKILTEPDVQAYERREGASILIRLGTQYHSAAVDHLRATIADRSAGTNAVVWAVEGIAELGPELHDEAVREYWRLADDPLADGFERARALGNLAKLGAANRDTAVARLRDEMRDPGIDLDTRYQMANSLSQLAPQYRNEVVQVLQEIIDRQTRPMELVEACNSLAMLGTEFRDDVRRAILQLLQQRHLNATATHRLIARTSEVGTPQWQRAVDLLAAAMADPNRSLESRVHASQLLAQLGQQFRGIAVGGFVSLLRSRAGLAVLDVGLHPFPSLGTTHRVRIVAEIRRLLFTGHSAPPQVVRAAGAMVDLGADDTADLVPLLLEVASNPTADIDDRVKAAVTVTGIDPSCRSNAITMLRSIAATTHDYSVWSSAVDGLADLDEDVVPLVRGAFNSPNAPRELREAAALVLARLRPEFVGEAIAELVDQCKDEHLSYWHRSYLILRLAEIDAATDDMAVTFHQAVLHDDSEVVNRRCDAASELVMLDRTHWSETNAVLRRICNDPIIQPGDRLQAITVLDSLNALQPGEVEQLALAVVHHPAAAPTTRRSAVPLLTTHTVEHVQRALLADRNAPVGTRIGRYGDAWEFPLRAEMEGHLREVLDAIETTRAARVGAAVELGDLSPELEPEADQQLQDLVFGADAVSFDVLDTLAQRGGRWRYMVIDRVVNMIRDESLSQRDRFRAASLAAIHLPRLLPELVAFLRATVAARRTSEIHRVEALSMLCAVDGPQTLRTVRDDDGQRADVRWRAARALIEYTADDRSGAVAILTDIAMDTTNHAELRWRVAEDLAKLGAPGRNSAIRALRAIVADPSGPVTACVRAAEALVEMRPNSVQEALTALRELARVDKSLHRLEALAARVSLQDVDAIPELRDMACNRALGPVVRLRSAESLADLRRDYRGTCAVVARDLLHDQTVPLHIRQRAARQLARWSEVNRGEARAALRSLTNR